MKKAIFLGVFLLAFSFTASGQVETRAQREARYKSRISQGLPIFDYPVDAEAARDMQRLSQLWTGRVWSDLGKTGGAVYPDPRLTGGAMYPQIIGDRVSGGAVYPQVLSYRGGALYGDRLPKEQPPRGTRTRNPPSGGFPAPSERRLRK